MNPIKRVLALMLVLAMCTAFFVMPASAEVIEDDGDTILYVNTYPNNPVGTTSTNHNFGTYNIKVGETATITLDNTLTNSCTRCGRLVRAVVPASYAFPGTRNNMMTDDTGWTVTDTGSAKLGYYTTDGLNRTRMEISFKGLKPGTSHIKITLFGEHYQIGSARGNCDWCGQYLQVGSLAKGWYKTAGTFTINVTCDHATKTATDNLNGTHTWTCDVCGETGTEAHTTTTVPGTAATCTEAGLTDGTKCTLCDYEVAGVVIPALNHPEANRVPITEQAATCTEAGHTAGEKCSLCDTILSGNETRPALGHDLVYSTEEATKDTKHTEICTREGCDYTATVDHTWDEGTVTKEATCSEEGETTYTCVCGATKTEPIQKLEHTSVDAAYKAPTCTEAGHEAGTKCEVCGEVLSGCDEIPAIGHNFANPVSNGNGTHTLSCINPDCSATKTDDCAYGEPTWSWTKAGNDSDFTAAVKHSCICGYIESTNDATVTKEVNGNQVKYTATYGEYTSEKIVDLTYTVTVENGVVQPGDANVGSYGYGEHVQAVADAAPEGKYFDGWYMNDTKVSSNTTYPFVVTGDIALTAMYKDAPVEAKPTVALTMGNMTAISGGYSLKMTASWSVPEGYQFVEGGIKRAYSLNGTIIKDTNALTTVHTSTLRNMNGTYAYTAKISTATANTKTVNAAAYIVVKNAAGDTLTLYSPICQN